MIALTSGATGCAALRDFIVPPDSQQHAKIQQTVARYASLIVDNVHVNGQRRAIALRAGQIAAVAPMAEVSQLRGTNTRVVDGHGGHAMAGLVDGEVELLSAAMLRDAIDLRGVSDEAELRHRLGGGRELLRGDDWIWARDLDAAMAGRLSGIDLVRLAPDLPVLITFASGDGALVSRTLLNLLPAQLRRPVEASGGRIGATLTRAVLRNLPEPRPSRLKPLLVQVLTGLRDRGVTTVQVMGASPLVWNTLIELERDRRLDLRCEIFLDGRHKGTEAVLRERELAARPKARSTHVPGAWRPRRVQLVGVEYWLDGGLDDHSAALSEDYADASGRGDPLPTDADLASWLRRADQLDLQLALHATGDAALSQAVRLLEGARRSPSKPPVRLNQVTVVPPALLARLARLNVVVGILAPTRRSVALAALRLGEQRGQWAVQGLPLAAECTVVLGSGLPGRRARPWRTFLSLTGGAGNPSPGASPWRPAQVLAAMQSDHLGRRPGLAVGTRADLVVWDRPWLTAGGPPRAAMVIVDAAVVSEDRLSAGAVPVEADAEQDADAPAQLPEMPTPTAP